MALTIPGKDAASKSGLTIPKKPSLNSLIIPGKTTGAEQADLLNRRSRIEGARAEAAAAETEASDAQNAARFLNVLGSSAQTVGSFGKVVGQSIARNVGSAALTVSGAIQTAQKQGFVSPGSQVTRVERVTADSLKAEDFKSFFGQALFETVFGQGEEIKSIEDRIAEAEPKVKAWQEELAKSTAETPDLNAREKFVTDILANLDAPSLAFTGIMGSVGLDLSGFGGLEKNAAKEFYKALIKEGTTGGGYQLLKSVGVAEDLAKHFASEIPKIKDAKAAKKFFDHIIEVSGTTKIGKVPVVAADPIKKLSLPNGMNTIKVTKKALEDAGYQPDDVNSILTDLADKMRMSLGITAVDAKDVLEAARQAATGKSSSTSSSIAQEAQKAGTSGPFNPTYRAASAEEWNNVQNTGRFEGRSINAGSDFDPRNPSTYDRNVTWTTTSKANAEQYAGQVTKSRDGVIIEFKPEAQAKMKPDRNGIIEGQYGSQNLSIDDVARVTDKNGKVIYEAPKSSPSIPKSPLAQEAQGGDGQIFYHGTNADIGANDLKPSVIGVLGDGVYLTPSKRTAQTYGKNVLEIRLPKLKLLKLGSKEAETIAQKNGTYVFPVEGKFEKALLDEGYDGLIDSNGNVAIKSQKAIDQLKQATKGGGREISIPSEVITSTKPQFERVVIPEPLKGLAESVVDSGYTKGDFLKRLGDALVSTDARKLARGKEIAQQIREAGFTPGRFFDAAHGRPLARTSELPKQRTTGGRATKRIILETISPDSPEVLTTEATLLRERMRNLSAGARGGAAATRADINRFQTDIIGLITRNLPVALRGKLLVAVRNATNITRLEKSMDKLAEISTAYDALRAQAKTLSGIRSRIAFIRKLAELNQTALNDVRRTLGIEKPLRKMNEAELTKVSDELIKRFQFKKEQGFLSKTAPVGRTNVSDEVLDEFSAAKPTVKEQVAAEARTIGQGAKAMAEDLLGVISTRLANIHPTLKYALRRFEHNSRVRALADTKVVEAFATKTSKLDARTYGHLDAAMKNGWSDVVNRIAKEHGFEAELHAMRDALDQIYERANKVGLKVDYRKNYFPRAFKQDKESTRQILDYFERNDTEGVLQTALNAEIEKLGRFVTDVEKVNIINTLLRGFRRNNINLSKTGSLKGRILDEIPPELNDLYQDSSQALFKYAESVNNLIESRRFFGKELDMKKIDSNPNMTDVIGAYVNKLIAKGDITSIDQLELQRILAARFSGGQMSPAWGALKDVGYISVMSSPLNAITQLGDLAWAFYRGGMTSAVKGFGDAVGNIAGMKNLTKEDLGIADIQAEFSDRTLLSKGVSNIFKYTGLNKIDRLGKETFINGVYRSLKDEAGNAPDALGERLLPIFGDESAQVISDLAKGDISENVKYLLFNELLDFQPIALSEVPLKYLEAPNGRVFYALKTFTLKLFDVYRREVFQQIKENPKQGMKNLVRLTAYLALFNATANQIKATMTGKETNLSDSTVAALAQAVGFNSYFLGQIQQEGIGKATATQILPTTQLIDDVSKDTLDIFKKGTELDPSQLRTIQDLPVGGKLFYWWFGRGATSKAKAEKAAANKRGGGSTIPSVSIPSVSIPSISIPSISI